MEEYIRLEEEKSQKHEKVFNWETAKYGRIWYDEDVHNPRSVEHEFPAIAFNESLTLGMLLNIIKNLYVPFGILFDPKRYYKDGDYARMLRRPRTKCLKFYNLCTILIDFIDMALPLRDQRHRYFRLARVYRREIHQVWVFDFEGLPDLMAEGLSARMLMEHRDAQG
nr:hypothetical protein [Tanacetum cinerariifolium]